MKILSLSALFVCALNIAACTGAPVLTDSGNNQADGSVQDVPNGSDVQTIGDLGVVGIDTQNGTDVPTSTDVVSAPDVPNADARACVMAGLNCFDNGPLCCPGLRCGPGVEGNRCAPIACAAGGEPCGLPGANACCGTLVCMQRGGPGGMVCADPMCRTVGQSCDAVRQCCPSGACGGPPGAQMCLPTP